MDVYYDYGIDKVNVMKKRGKRKEEREKVGRA
jgi:hypothetical protein